MHRYRLFYSLRMCYNRKFSSLLILLICGCTMLFLTTNFSKTIDYQLPSHLNSSSYLIVKQKVLVPVGINHLYDYQVVCKDQDGILDRKDLIKQLSTTCQVNLQEKVNITLDPPKDFQVRSLSTSWQTNSSCSLYSNETIAIIISYRDRQKNLRILLYNLIPFLQRQKIANYKFFIVEQIATGAFNKGQLYNIAYNHVMKTYNATCIIFHDVDLIPEDNQNIYSCLNLTDHPSHLSANVRFQMDGKYTQIYSFLVGGVLAMRPNVFEFLNGYSNKYFNWGGEDDDIGLRFLAKDICVQRPINGYYYAHSHAQQKRNPNRFQLLFDAILRQDIDGLTNIDQLATVTNIFEYPLITWMTINWIEKR